ncbi:MAG: TetR family transcriptional regulator [Myxococcales bacterium]|nr:TetR family transcriptional regulator [Myxococcales bacterium]
MARPSNTAERKSQIVAALIRVMARTGYDGASVTQVAAEAGLAPGLVHYHFENKREILLAAIDELERRVGARWLARRGKSRDAWGQLRSYLDAHVALGRDRDPDAVACWVVIGAEAVRDAEVRAAYERAVSAKLAELGGLVRETLVEEGRDPRAAASIAAALLSAVEGAYRLALVAQATPSGFAAPMLRRIAESLVAGAKKGPRR